MTETEHLIHQAARELQIDERLTTTVAPMGIVATFKRKDGSDGGVFFRFGAEFTEIIARLRDESKSEVKATAARERRIADLEAELAALKSRSD